MSTTFLNYKPAKLHKTKQGWFIEYSVLERAKLRRKRIWLNSIPQKERRLYAENLAHEINRKLTSEWSPDEGKKSVTIEDALKHYFTAKKKELRKRTYQNYYSDAKIIASNFSGLKLKEITKQAAGELLNEIYISKKWQEYRYNRFLGFCISLWNYFKEFQFVDINIFENFRKKKEKLKFRIMFSDNQLEQYFDYLNKIDKWFLLTSYYTYYCFIRPNEISKLKIKDFHLKDKFLAIPSDVSKNGRRQIITLPNKVVELMYDLDFYKYPKEYLICSSKQQPGKEYRTSIYIAKKFAKIRTKLDFPKKIQFYSLKDTGIVKMIRVGVPLNIVRDQARHYSLEVTNRYVQIANEGASDDILTKVNY